MIIHSHRLDMVPGGPTTIVRVNQYDEDFTIRLSLYAREGAFTVESGTTASIRGTKPDGNGYSATCTMTTEQDEEQNTVPVVVVTGDQQMTAAAGLGEFEITLLKNNDELNTANFTLNIERAALDKDTVASDSKIREFVEVYDKADEIITAGAQYASYQQALEDTAAEAAASAESAAESAATATETLETIQQEYETENAELDQKISNANDVIDEKTDAIRSLVVTSNQTAAQALSKAGNVENDVADLSTDVARISTAVQSLETSRTSHLTNLTVVNGALYGINEEGDIITDPIEGINGGDGGGGGGSSATSSINISNTSGFNSKTIADGDALSLSISWSSVESEMPTGNGTLLISVNGAIKATMDVPQGEVTVDVAPYLTSGANTVRLTVIDMYDNSRFTAFNITVVALSLSSTFDTSRVYDSTIDFAYTPTGSVQKTIYFVLDGREIDTVVTSVSGRQMSYVLPQQSHGAHSIECYFDCTINGQTVESNHLYYEFTCIEPLNNTPVITSSFNQTTVAQFTVLNVVYGVYTPTSDTSSVSLYQDSNLVNTLTVDRTQQTWAIRMDQAGSHTLKIRSGSEEKTFNITVTASDIQIEAETDRLALYLGSQGRSNSEDHPEQWVSNAGETVSATLTGFDYTSDGWQLDEDGITCLRVSGNARVQVPYQPFASDARRDGLTIEIEYATRNVSNYNATVLSCMSGGRGLLITPQRATLTSEQTELSMQYKENEHIRVAYTIEKRAENRLIRSFIDGTPARVAQYPDDDDFSQVSPVGISIGSNDCTIDIYCIRVYTNNLTHHQVLDNWIADTQDGALMRERYLRNQIYDAYNRVVPSKLPTDLPYMIIDAEELPQFKGDKKTVSGSYTDPLDASRSFTFTGCEIDRQGTSSSPYYRPNLDMKFKNGFEMERGGHAGTFKLRDTSVPTARFVGKANVASSEMANNTELVRLYNDICPYKTPEMIADSRVRWGIDGYPIVIFWHNITTDTVKFYGNYDFNFPKRFAEGYGYTA